VLIFSRVQYGLKSLAVLGPCPSRPFPLSIVAENGNFLNFSFSGNCLVFHQTRIAFVASCILSSLNYGVNIPPLFHPVTKDAVPEEKRNA